MSTTVMVVVLLASAILVAQRRVHLTEQVQTTVASLNSSRGIILPRLKDLDEFPRELVTRELRSQFESAAERRKLPLAYALAHYDDVRIEFLVSHVVSASPFEVDNFVTALHKSTTQAVAAVEAVARTAERDENWRHMARLSMLALHLKSPSLAEEMCQLRANPIQRTLFIDECSSWHGDLARLSQVAAERDDPAFCSGIALILGSVPVAYVTQPEIRKCTTMLNNWYQNKSDTITHSATDWALRQWKLQLPHVAESKEPVHGLDWHLNSVGMTMLKIPAGSFVHQDSWANRDWPSRKVTFTRSILLLDREVTGMQYQQFVDDPDYPDGEKPSDWKKGIYTPSYDTKHHPVENVNWYDAILFCNWLSLKERLTPYYEWSDKKEFTTRDHDSWRFNLGANGYRLPTEAEWEYACRAGSTTTFSHGNDQSLLDRYAVYSGKSLPELAGSKLPNAWGLFDVHGNVSEWCQDWEGMYGEEEVTDPMGPNQGTRRMIRGGSYGCFASAES